jgi:hypothetical protein
VRGIVSIGWIARGLFVLIGIGPSQVFFNTKWTAELKIDLYFLSKKIESTRTGFYKVAP